MTDLKLFNSMTRQLEIFEDPKDNEARVYTCGPTVYNYPHIGNMRAYIFADTLGRVLLYKGYKLKHIINITDVGHLTDDGDAGEDKMEKMAAAKKLSAREVADHYTHAYWSDFKALNCREPAHWSIATDYVPQMIEYAKGIADKHCYELDSGLYFDTATVANYGALARAKTEDGEGRIEAVDGKRHAADFAIWRKTPIGETRQMEWDSPWGRGAPGWHLECSVMSEALLGLPFDIHTGGIDHREIHHPNEIAQNQAHSRCDHSGAKVWMHNNFLIDRTGKMSKSSGEFLRLQLLIDRGFHPLAYRLMCLQAHYRSELEFSWEGLQAALVRLKRMVMGVETLKSRHAELVSASIVQPSSGLAEKWTLKQVQGDETIWLRFGGLFELIDGSACDDLNTPGLLLWIQSALELQDATVEEHLLVLGFIDQLLGLNLLTLTRKELRIRPVTAVITEAEIEAALAQRKEARATKNFARSDAIRDDLIAKGIEVMDGDPLGWDWQIEV